LKRIIEHQGLFFGEGQYTVKTAGLRVLVVDDERTIADTLAVIFSQSGYAARAVYSAEQALDIVAQWSPDFAILDVILPQMHGIDLAVLLTERLPKCQILLFSGQALTADLLAEAEKKGYTFTILAKPVHPSLLLDTVVRVLAAAKETLPGLKDRTPV
jgi:DNA-binding NtrC family response regulator